jgi:hypothetical protein
MGPLRESPREVVEGPGEGPISGEEGGELRFEEPLDTDLLTRIRPPPRLHEQ